MSTVFGRNSNSHPYDEAIAQWCDSTDTWRRAMARNVMHDHRVSKAREHAFDTFGKQPRTPDDLEKAIVKYFEEKIRTKTLPHYVYRTVNENNLLIGADLLKPRIHKDVQLVRVLDLNGLGRVLQWARIQKKWGRVFADFPRSQNDQEISRWIDGILQGAPREKIEQFVATVLDIMNKYRQAYPFQPTWATTWSAFEAHERHGPDRWLQVLGMPKPAPRWLILLRYPVREAGTIARPTQLDAGWQGYHFPSPPQAPLFVGGHPMDLRIFPKPTSLLPEYIHKQIDHPLYHWTNLGGKIGRTQASSREELSSQRKVQHELLASIYGRAVYSWMPNPI